MWRIKRGVAEKNAHDLLSAALNFKSVKVPSHSNPAAIHKIGQIITAGYRNLDIPKFEADFAAFRPHTISNLPNSTRAVLAKTLAPEGLQVLRRLADKGSLDEIYWATSRFCAGRKSFSTRDGRTHFGPEFSKKGDL